MFKSRIWTVLSPLPQAKINMHFITKLPTFTNMATSIILYLWAFKISYLREVQQCELVK